MSLKLSARIVYFLLTLSALSRPGSACAPESYFLFRSEAQSRLDSVATGFTEENTFERLVLMHNLAFHKDKKQREEAEKLLEKQFPRQNRNPLLKAYAGSLKMIKVSHRSTGSKVMQTINPFTKSPQSEGRDGFREISEAVALDSANTVLRILRATAAAESAEHLDELFDSARIDLEWLQAHTEPADSVCQFLLHLNWAKYHFKLAKRDQNNFNLAEAVRYVELAISYACTPVYRDWAEDWRTRIKKVHIGNSNKQ